MSSGSENCFYSWIAGFPLETRHRLRQINDSAGSATHVVLALAYGLCDVNIRALNRVIVQLLLCRMRAERNNNVQVLENVQAKLADIHEAIDWFCELVPVGVRVSDHSRHNVCNKIKT